MPKPRYHQLNLRIDEDLHRLIRDEADASTMSISAVVRRAPEGVARVAGKRIAHEQGIEL